MTTPPDPPASGRPADATVVRPPGTPRSLDPADLPLPAVPEFELLEVVGRGGMGVVHRGRDLALGRDVAVKLLQDRFAADGPAARRFVEEARITGQLQHPGIPSVHRVGATADGRPFLAMKLIKGRTLADLLADPAPDRGRLVAAFEAVCQAVGYAHAHGVVHRDLKPQNVMVGAFGEVQVMDWGLAKVLPPGGRPPAAGDADTAPGTAVVSAREVADETQAGSFLGTPAYMAPEQAIGAVDQIDARTDVFGLGAILCAVLTGQPPYPGRDPEAVRQSAARGQLGDAFGRLGGCGAEPELVALCRRCLAAEKADRPRDAGEVAAAVGRLRADAEGRARRAEVDRARAEVREAEARRRRRAQAALAAGAGAVLIGLAGLGWWENDRRARNRDAMADALTRCETALREDDADRAAASLADAERRAGEGGAAPLRDRLDRRRAELTTLRDLDRLAGYQWAEPGDKPRGVGYEQVVAAECPAAFARLGVVPGQTPVDHAAGVVNESPIRTRLLTGLDTWLVGTGSADVLAVLRAADPDPFRTAFREAVAARSPALHDLVARPEVLAQPPGFVVQLTYIPGLPPRRVAAALRAAWDRDPTAFNVAMTLGTFLTNQVEGAADREKWLRAALALRPDNGSAWTSLGTALRDQGDLDGALAAQRRAVELAPGNPSFHFNLGNTLRFRKDLAGAAAQYREAVRVDPTYAKGHYNLGNALLGADPRAAAASYREAIRLDPLYNNAHYMLGIALDKTGDLDGAAAAFRQALRLNVDNADAHRRLGQVLRQKGRFDAAAAAFRESLRLDPDHAPTHYALGQALDGNGKPDEALAAYREAVRHDPKLTLAHVNIGVILRDRKDPAGAIAAQRRAIALDPREPLAHYNLGVALADKGDRPGAEAAYREAVRLDPTGNPSAHNNLGSALAMQGDPAAAVPHYREAVRLRPDRADYERNLQAALAMSASREAKPRAVAPPPREAKR
jgi:tetratricopeptide (TPR) repeat protein